MLKRYSDIAVCMILLVLAGCSSLQFDRQADAPSITPTLQDNYLAALVVDGSRAGLAYADITTGEFATTQISANSAGEARAHLVDELDRLSPAELALRLIFAWFFTKYNTRSEIQA